jgi:hypothetical protein
MPGSARLSAGGGSAGTRPAGPGRVPASACALRYDIVRRVPAADGVLQQHVLRGRLPNGAEVELHAAMYLQVRDGRITRTEEYLDSAKRASIKAAREALSG